MSNDLIKAINAEFGEGKTQGAVFFHHNPDGSIKSMSPLFQMGPATDPKSLPGSGIRELVATMKAWAKAINFMADDMVKRTLPKN